MAFANRLKADGIKVGGWVNRNKFTAAKHMLERAGLIHCFDGLYLAKGPDGGVGMRCHVGPNHPMYPDFVAFCSAEPPPVNRVNGDRPRLSRPFDGATTEVISTIFATATVRVAA